MEAVIEKWDNGLGIKIPNMMAHELELTDGIFIEISHVGQEIRIHRIHEPEKTSEPVGFTRSFGGWEGEDMTMDEIKSEIKANRKFKEQVNLFA